MLETEIVFCPCGHDFEAFSNDLGTYQCPECFDKVKNKRRLISSGLKPLDAAFKEMDSNEYK